MDFQSIKKIVLVGAAWLLVTQAVCVYINIKQESCWFYRLLASHHSFDLCFPGKLFFFFNKDTTLSRPQPPTIVTALGQGVNVWRKEDGQFE